MRHSALLSILVLCFLPGAPASAELEPPQAAALTSGLNLLGVSQGSGAEEIPQDVGAQEGATPAAPSVAAAPVTVPPVDGDDCAGNEALRRWIHRDRQQTALIVRGGRFGIAPDVQALVGRIADLLDGMPDIQRFLRETFQRNYLSDEAAVTRQLEGMGYRVVLVTSADLGGGLKARVTRELADPSTSVLVYFGHQGPDYMGMTDRRENSAPGRDEVRAQIQGQEIPESSMNSAEIKAAMGDRRLTGMILQGCNGGQSAYLAEKAGRATVDFGTCVEPDRGFLAGWVTYSVYFTPKTTELVNRYFCHMARVKAAQDGARVDLRESARYWKRNVGITRKMAEIAGMSDRDNLGADFAAMEADTNVHPHTEEQIPALAGLEIYIDLAHSVKTQPSSLGDDVKTFITRYYRYCVENRISLDRDGRRAPALGQNPSIAQINAFMEFHGRHILRDAFRILLPNIALFNGGRLRIDPDNNGKLLLDLDLDFRNSRELDQGLDFLRSIVEQPLTASVRAIPGGIGPQLATRIRSTLDLVRSKLPDTLGALRLSLSIEKRIQAGNVSLVPLVHGYNLCIGNVPARVRDAGRSPYQVHVALDAATELARLATRPLSANQTELTFSRAFVTVYAYIKLFSLGAIRGSGNSLTLPTVWELEINWPNPGVIFGGNATTPGYAYTDIDISAAFAPVPGQPLQISITPTVNIRLRQGWPGGLGLSIITPIINRKVNEQIAASFGNTVDLAQFIPASVLEEVRGRVRLGGVNVNSGVVSVTFEHER